MRAIVLLSLVAVALASQECGENEHFESCGTACPLTCKNYKNPPKFCILRCDIGCQCDEGYVRAEDGRCVKPEQCPASSPFECGENEHFESCGTACPLTCENYQNPPKICVLRCDIGCQCDKGYVRSADGRCVRPEQCPSSGPIPKETNCVDKPETGLCMAYFPMWYYDAFTQKCHKFVYGGCGGNGNRYRTEEECMKSCEGVIAEEATTEACDMPAETGVCRGYFPRFYFDRTTGTCQKFIYGGCGGNENNFETIEECQRRCGKAAPTACLQEKVVGPCRGLFPRFYYNKETGQCEKFTYGGCQGNSNNFMSKEDCEGVCKGVIAEEATTEACDMPAETGVCRGYFPRFYFDRTTGTCQKFIYGGCGGNENNFETIEECQRRCGKAAPTACLQEKVVGPCRGLFPRFYYNKETGQCEKFTYGGCQGNSNNFMSKEDCEGVCKA